MIEQRSRRPRVVKDATLGRLVLDRSLELDGKASDAWTEDATTSPSRPVSPTTTRKWPRRSRADARRSSTSRVRWRRSSHHQGPVAALRGHLARRSPLTVARRLRQATQAGICPGGRGRERGRVLLGWRAFLRSPDRGASERARQGLRGLPGGLVGLSPACAGEPGYWQGFFTNVSSPLTGLASLTLPSSVSEPEVELHPQAAAGLYGPRVVAENHSCLGAGRRPPEETGSAARDSLVVDGVPAVLARHLRGNAGSACP